MQVRVSNLSGLPGEREQSCAAAARRAFLCLARSLLTSSLAGLQRRQLFVALRNCALEVEALVLQLALLRLQLHRRVQAGAGGGQGSMLGGNKVAAAGYRAEKMSSRNRCYIQFGCDTAAGQQQAHTAMRCAAAQCGAGRRNSRLRPLTSATRFSSASCSAAAASSTAFSACSSATYLRDNGSMQTANEDGKFTDILVPYCDVTARCHAAKVAMYASPAAAGWQPSGRASRRAAQGC